jgi:hypothetical protein
MSKIRMARGIETPHPTMAQSRGTGPRAAAYDPPIAA